MNRFTPTAFVPLVAIALASASPLAAQEPGTVNDPFLLPPLVVTATQVPVSPDRLPTIVTVLTRASLDAQGIRTVADALRTVSGLAVVRAGTTGAQTSIFVRGGESDYVKILVDGVPLNNAGGPVDLAEFSTDNLDRIEVVKGPVSVLYGSDAAAGVVQIFTVRGRGAPRVEVTAMGGLGERRLSDERHGAADVEASVAGSTGSYSYSFGGGFSWNGGTYALNNENSLGTGSARLAWEGTSGTSVTLSARASDGAYHYPTDDTGNPVDANAVSDRRNWSVGVTASHPLSDRIATEIELGVSDRSLVSTDELDDPSDASGHSVYRNDVRGSSVAANLIGRTGAHSLTVGVAHESLSGESSTEGDGAFGPYSAEGEYDRATTSGYAEIFAVPFPALSAMLGARADRTEEFGTFATYRVGISWEALPETRVRAALGRAFRAPTFIENHGSGFGDVGNLDLVPERTSSWEIGLERAVGPVRLSGTWFDQQFRDLIQSTFSPPPPETRNYFNVAAAEASGLELGAEGRRGALAVSGGYTWLRTSVVDAGLASGAAFQVGEALLRRPEHSGNLGIRYRNGRVGASLRANLVGERADVDFGAFPAARVALDPYATFGISAEYGLSSTGAVESTLLLSVDNLFDAAYEEVLGYAPPGRVIRLGARVRTGG